MSTAFEGRRGSICRKNTLLKLCIQNLQGVPEWFGEDGYGNRFYLVDNGCLYVEYGAKLNELSAEEGSGPSIVSRSYLFRLVIFQEKQPRKWKLIADTEKMWYAIALIMERSAFRQAHTFENNVTFQFL